MSVDITPDDDLGEEHAHFRDAATQLLSQDPTMTSLTLATHTGVPHRVLVALAHNRFVQTAHFEMTDFDDARCKRLCALGRPTSADIATPDEEQNHMCRSRCAVRVSHGQRTHQFEPKQQPTRRRPRATGQSVSQSRLAVLNLNDTIRREGGRALVPFAEALAGPGGGSNRLRALHLQKNGVADEVATDLAAPWAAAGVQELHLSTNRIGDAGGQALALACSHATSGLRKLTLLSNAIGDAAAASFGTILADNPLLEQLNLSHNRIGDQGVAALVRGVQDNTRLRMLDVGVNKLCSRQAKAALEGAMAREALIGASIAHSAAPRDCSCSRTYGTRAASRRPLCRLPEGCSRSFSTWRSLRPAIADRAVA